METLNEKDKNDLSDLDTNIFVDEFNLLNDHEFIDIGVKFFNDTNKPIYIKRRSLVANMDCNYNLSDEEITRKSFPTNFHNRVTLKEGVFFKINPNENITIPLYFFNNNIFKTITNNEKFIKESIKYEDFKINVSIKSKMKKEEIFKEEINRNKIVNRISEIKNIENYENIFFIEDL